MRRVVLFVIDGLGVGALPDADGYGDAGADTLRHAAEVGRLHAPILSRLGLGRVCPAPGLDLDAVGVHGKMAERSAAKDSMTGHRELAGIVATEPLETFPEGFPPAILEPFERAIGRRVLGNVVMPGTEVLDPFGERARAEGRPIIYTSADSVMQIAAHTDSVGVEELYRWCAIAREACGARVGRVIARPFAGEPGGFRRLHEARRDLPVPLPSGSLVDRVTAAGLGCVAVGKVADLFGAERFHTTVGPGPDEQMAEACRRWLEKLDAGLVFGNAGDVDSHHGHRNDPEGWCTALGRLDAALGELADALGDDDVLMVTGDHGNDPVMPSTDHSREYVPVLATTGRRWRDGGDPVDVGTRPTFADAGATVAELLGAEAPAAGTSFARVLAG